MSEDTQKAKRAGARIFGSIFQFLAVFALLGTIWATAEVASLGSQIGIDGTKDPATWIVLVSGLFVSCVLAGFGYTLGMLCAIYDRQSMHAPVAVVAPKAIPTSYSLIRPTYYTIPTMMSTKPQPEPTPPIQRDGSVSIQSDVEQPTTPVARRNILWEWLTRERHF